MVEAGIKSGALITAKIAKKYNRKIYAVPGPLTSSVSMGTSLLIKEGASIVTGVEDILQEYGISPQQVIYAESKIPGLKGLQKRIVDLVLQEPKSIDELTRILEMTISETGAELTKLCLRKTLIFTEGKYYLGASYAD